MRNGFVLLEPGKVEVLGGRVPALLERWRMQKQLAEHSRAGDAEDAAPRFGDAFASSSGAPLPVPAVPRLQGQLQSIGRLGSSAKCPALYV